MNREIKFRAWDVESNEMTLPNDILEVLVSMKNEVYAMVKGRNETLGGINRDNTILMQYTGLKDKNGTEIYEGDIVRLQNSPIENGVDYNALIVFKYGGFCAIDGTIDNYAVSRYRLSDFDLEITVLGNIYENPELLERVEE